MTQDILRRAQSYAVKEGLDPAETQQFVGAIKQKLSSKSATLTIADLMAKNNIAEGTKVFSTLVWFLYDAFGIPIPNYLLGQGLEAYFATVDLTERERAICVMAVAMSIKKDIPSIAMVLELFSVQNNLKIKAAIAKHFEDKSAS